MTDRAPSLRLNAKLISRLRRDLEDAQWTSDAVEKLFSPQAHAAMVRDQLVPASVEIGDNASAAALLTKLFILAEPIPLTGAKSVFPHLGLDGAANLGLVECKQDLCRALVDLRPHTAEIVGPQLKSHHWWVASDLSQAQTGEPPNDDFVLGIASASVNLLRLTMREVVDSALDLGCGCGILALYLSTHACRVIATDISSRACNFTQFNAALNNSPIEVRQGSLFEPVAGEKFDLITSNPPFVITPESIRTRANLEYRDGGMSRDSLIPLIIKQAVNHLASGGTLQMLANWEITDVVETWAARPTQWIEDAASPVLATGLTMDSWVVQRDVVDVAQYAEWWMRDAWGYRVDAGRWASEYREWLQDFSRAGVRYVGLGSIALRLGRIEAQTSLNLVCEYLPEGEPVDGEAVSIALDNLTLPTDWVDRPLRRALDVREVRYYIPGLGDPELVRVTQGRAGGRERTVTSSVAALIGVSDGELTPSQVIPAIAMLLDRTEEETIAEIRNALPELLRSGTLSF